MVGICKHGVKLREPTIKRNEESDAAAIMAMLEDKIAFVKRAGISTTFYIGFTGGTLIDRIETDEALSGHEDKIHGLALELSSMIQRKETMIPLIVTGHWGPNGPSAPPPSVDTASLAEDAQIHPRIIENLMVAFRGKEGLMNLDDGGGSSRSAPHLVSGSLRGCFALNTISPLRRVRLRWSLDATDGHAFGTEQKHLIRTVPILLDQDCQDGESHSSARACLLRNSTRGTLPSLETRPLRNARVVAAWPSQMTARQHRPSALLAGGKLARRFAMMAAEATMSRFEPYLRDGEAAPPLHTVPRRALRAGAVSILPRLHPKLPLRGHSSHLEAQVCCARSSAPRPSHLASRCTRSRRSSVSSSRLFSFF